MIELPRALHVNVAQLADTRTFSERAALLAEVCRARAASLDAPDPLIRHALKQWSAAERALPAVSVLTRDIGLSERAFERRFVAQVGLTPVLYRRLARFRAVLRLHAKGVRAVTVFDGAIFTISDGRWT
jgi:methylphosphotriester-DNA--protein-cysteine methyltransferase